MTYSEVVNKLESLSIMPKTMPGLEKLRQALQHKTWFVNLDPKKIITVAGTNGKGTTCATLETLLLAAGQKVGLFTSPHLISTTERLRINGCNISETDFIALFKDNKALIEKYELTHFESLTLMAADYFFANNNLDFVIFEVGLGGTFDATNVFPNSISVITSLGLDHQNILGHSLIEIAKNKFGIIKNNSIIIHHPIDDLEIKNLLIEKAQTTNSKIILAKPGQLVVSKNDNSFQEPCWFIETEWGKAQINLPGLRAVENIMTALTVFFKLGFNPQKYLQCLAQISWQGRMQKISWPTFTAPLFLSGDHNVQGVKSLLSLLKHYEWKELHIIVGIGFDKEADNMLQLLMHLERTKLYLTETPFKGRTLNDYPEPIRQAATEVNKDAIAILNNIKPHKNDMVLVTGSLYLVGQVLRCLAFKQS